MKTYRFIGTVLLSLLMAFSITSCIDDDEPLGPLPVPTPTPTPAPEDDIFAKERAALIDLYQATDGAHWKKNDNWGSDKPLSEWYGLTLDVRGMC